MPQAGYLKSRNDDRLIVTTGSEAAVKYCLKTSVLNLGVKDVVLIVECGGATVDRQAYELTSASPCSFPKYTLSSGDTCRLVSSASLCFSLGWANHHHSEAAVLRHFANVVHTRLRKRVLPAGSKAARRAHAKSIVEFHRRSKDDFRHAGQNWVVDVDIEADFPWAGIEKGCMEYTNGDILLYFKPVANRVVEMACKHIIAIYAWNGTLKVYH
jgi:hypothetical protein